MSVTLATTYHDGNDRMFDQIARVLPSLTTLFHGIAIQASSRAPERSLTLLATAGAAIQRDDPNHPAGATRLGNARRRALALALHQDAPVILFFDFDSLLHWTEHYRDELAAVLPHLIHYDMTIIGRTPRALDSHPQSQRATEVLVKQLFAHLTGSAWDVMRSGRGLSRRAAETIVRESHDDSISTDVSWPLLLLHHGDFTLTSIAVEGTEFETQDRYQPEVTTAGGQRQWLEHIDRDPRRWADRFNLARMHAEAMIPFAGSTTRLEST
jgi:hypothetical protein